MKGIKKKKYGKEEYRLSWFSSFVWTKLIIFSRNTRDDDSQYELHQSRDRILVKVKMDLPGDHSALRE